jgi:hypothetical protein
MRIAAFAPALALAAILALPSRSPASPQFTKMSMAISTSDRAKAAETSVEISIVPDAGGPAVAYLDIQGVEFAPYGTVRVAVPAAGGGFTRDQLPHMHIELRISGESAGMWHTAFDAVLNFDDGSQALLGSGSLRLSGARPEASVPLSLATVAGTGLLGHVEKFGFGLMSKSAASPESAPVSSVPHKSTKDFTHMDIALDTGARGAEPGTRVEVSIEPRAGGPAVAYLDIRDRVFAPYSKVSEVVLPAGDGFTSADLKKEQVVIKVTPPGGGTWTCSFDAIIHFADGSQALLGSGDLVLSAVRDVETVPLSLATTAHASILGGVEKFGFKLLSRSGVKQTQEPEPAAPAGSGAAAGAPGSAAQQEAARAARPVSGDEFTGMDVKLYSSGKGKGADVPVEISIGPKGGGAAVAYLSIQGQAIAPGTSVREVVPPAGEGFTQADLKGEQVIVRITPPGRCTWTHGLDIVIHFADGTAALWSTGDLVLSDYHNEEVISLSDVSVARGFLGGVKKFGFGLLNTIGK